MAASGAGSPARLVQYVVVRSDLVHKLSWPLGAVITQACHAATAAIHLHYEEPDTQQYLSELDSMHKVVLAVSDITPDSIQISVNLRLLWFSAHVHRFLHSLVKLGFYYLQITCFSDSYNLTTHYFI